MIANLRDTTRTNKEQDWLKTNLAKFFGVMQGQRNLQSLTDQVMSQLTPVVGAQHGAFYLAERENEATSLKLTSTYAYTRRKDLSVRFTLGEGVVGQCALERKAIVVTELPEGYVQITSGLGHAPPRSIAVFPVLFEDQVRGVIELATFAEFTPVQLNFLEQLMLNIGLAINLIGTSMRTEQLLQQLQGSNVELDRRRKELEDRAQLLEARNLEIARASASLEAKSEELARVSAYKSQFLTNMSHEIRTPLNSMMILAQMLAANEGQNLTGKQREWAETIHSSGRDLLALLNQILDLSKVEAGRIETHRQPYSLGEVRDFVDRTFRPVALQRGLDFAIEIASDAPRVFSVDRQLLEQILKNLLANAMKFTERGRVQLRIDQAPAGHIYLRESLVTARRVLAFAVSDTGIGIPQDQQGRIFEAFQQADATITRRYGGTGLGLTISREYARIIGGEISLESTPGTGSTFTLYLPIEANELPVPEPEKELPIELPPEPEPEDVKALAGKRILVVEDDPRNLYAATAMLERYGAVVIPASSAREAYAALETQANVDLVLMDIMLPEIDGFEATRHIRAMPGFADLPIVALTAKASASDRSRTLEAGCVDYVLKPVDARRLLSVILRHPRR
jgi:signal transduction histidine kinase/CheY-like chemotaxis protein